MLQGLFTLCTLLRFFVVHQLWRHSVKCSLAKDSDQQEGRTILSRSRLMLDSALLQLDSYNTEKRECIEISSEECLEEK